MHYLTHSLFWKPLHLDKLIDGERGEGMSKARGECKVPRSDALVGFYVWFMQTGITREEETLLRKCFHWMAHKQACGGIFLTDNW